MKDHQEHREVKRAEKDSGGVCDCQEGRIKMEEKVER